MQIQAGKQAWPATKGHMSSDTNTSLIRLQLTPEQTDQLAPIVIEAAGRRQNVLFVAAAVPFWSRQDEANDFTIKFKTISARIVEELNRLVQMGDGHGGEATVKRVRKSSREQGSQ
jgi:hypothetical protein